MYKINDVIKEMSRIYKKENKNDYLTQAEAKEQFKLVMKALGNLIMDTNEDGVMVQGLFKAQVIIPKRTEYLDPRNGKKVKVEPKERLVITPSKKLRDLDI